MDKNSVIKAISVLFEYFFLNKSNKPFVFAGFEYICLGNKAVIQNWLYSLLGNFADVIYQNKQSFLHRTGDVCTL